MLTQRNRSLIAVAVALPLLVFAATSGRAGNRPAAFVRFAAPARQAAPADKPAEQFYKNIQALKGMRANELDGVMDFMCAALGVGCAYCHASSYDSDEKTAKNATRRMILMTRAINAEHFSSSPAVTCYTCHHGQHNTFPNPPADLRAPEAESTHAEAAALPSAEEIIDRFTRAIGGEKLAAETKTLILGGTETLATTGELPRVGPFGVIQAAPDRLLVASGKADARVTYGFDGANAWTSEARQQNSTLQIELPRWAAALNLIKCLNLRENYPQRRVLARETLRGREVYVVGATSRDDSREKLYFDAETGLLNRKYIAFKTAFGTIPETTDFDEYRNAAGLKLPFLITWSRPPFTYAWRMTEMKVNQPVDDAAFKPRAKR